MIRQSDEQGHDGDRGGDADAPRVHLELALGQADLIPDERRHVLRCQRDQLPKRLLSVGAIRSPAADHRVPPESSLWQRDTAAGDSRLAPVIRAERGHPARVGVLRAFRPDTANQDGTRTAPQARGAVALCTTVWLACVHLINCRPALQCLARHASAAGRAWVPDCRDRTFNRSVRPFYDKGRHIQASRRDQFVISIGTAVHIPFTAEISPVCRGRAAAAGRRQTVLPARGPGQRPRLGRAPEKLSGHAKLSGGTSVHDEHIYVVIPLRTRVAGYLCVTSATPRPLIGFSVDRCRPGPGRAPRW